MDARQYLDNTTKLEYTTGLRHIVDATYNTLGRVALNERSLSPKAMNVVLKAIASCQVL